MRLDPDNQKVLDMMAASGAPPIAALDPAAARRAFDEIDLAPDSPVLDDVRDMEAPGPLGAISLRYYRGQDAPKAQAAALVFYHGGGWTIGSLDSYDYICRKLANAAHCVVVSVDYRLAPENKFPAAVVDCQAALKWVVGNAATLGIDAKRVAVGGDSAGGNLSAVMAHMARDGDAPPVCFQALVYPACDMNTNFERFSPQLDRFVLSAAAMKYFIANYLNGETEKGDWRASPSLAKNFKGLAPALVMTTGFDPLGVGGEAYAQTLEAAGIQVSHIRLADQMHGFLSFGRVVRAADMGLEMMAAALRRAFDVAGR
jgi:acetyl esterase